MATTKTASSTSSVKNSKKQKISNTNNNSNLTNLMLTAELLNGPTVDTDAQPQAKAIPEPIPPSLWEAMKNSPQFINMMVALACSFFVSAIFYCAAKTMMKTKFDDMFVEKLPRYKNLIYGIGTVQNIDVDRILLRDDLNDQYFVPDESNNSITIDVQKILEQCKPDKLLLNQDSKAIFMKNNTLQFQDEQMDDELDSTNLEVPVRTGLAQAKKQSSV